MSDSDVLNNDDQKKVEKQREIVKLECWAVMLPDGKTYCKVAEEDLKHMRLRGVKAVKYDGDSLPFKGYVVLTVLTSHIVGIDDNNIILTRSGGRYVLTGEPDCACGIAIGGKLGAIERLQNIIRKKMIM